MVEPVVVLAHSPRDWAQRLHFFVMDHGGAVVRGYAMTVEEILADAPDVAVLDDVTSFLSPLAIERLHERGVAVIGVFEDVSGEPGKWRLLELGVDAVLVSDAPPEAFVAEIADVARDARHARTRAGEGDRARAPQRGDLIAIASAGGGTGATEVSVALATALGRSGVDTVIVDADDQSPGLAARLQSPLHPNLLSALDALLHRSGSITDCLHAVDDGWHSALPGIVSPREWKRLRGTEVVDLLLALRADHTCVIANTGPRIEELTGHAPGARFAVARAVVAAADAVVAVAVASPTGLRRLLEWAVEAQPLVGDRPVHVVLNRHAGGASTRGQLTAELAAAWSPASVTVTPYDTAVVGAEWRGATVPRGPFTNALSPLVKQASAP
ncbi:MAG: hypothetical protein ACE5GC_02085 [Acidimicrobiia bacterium]